MSHDMASDDGDDQQLIEELHQQLIAITAKLEQLEARHPGQPPEQDKRRRLTVIPGGRSALVPIAILGAVADRARRHPAALVGTATALGTAVIVLVAPQGGTAPTQQLSLPPAASVSTSLHTTPTTPPTPGSPAPSPSTPTSLPASMHIPPSTPTPAPVTSGTAPATPGTTPAAAPSAPPSTASAAPTPTATCTVEVIVHGVIRVCLT